MKSQTKKTIMRWSYHGLSRMPRSVSGVYAFWRRDTGKCIYVGQSQERPIQRRLREHWRYSHNETLRLWIKSFGGNLDVCYMPVEKSKVTAFEKRLIKAWRPEANKQYNL